MMLVRATYSLVFSLICHLIESPLLKSRTVAPVGLERHMACLFEGLGDEIGAMPGVTSHNLMMVIITCGTLVKPETKKKLHMRVGHDGRIRLLASDVRTYCERLSFS